MRRLLRIIAGPNEGQCFLVSDNSTTLLGRSQHTNAQLADQSVSRVHCEIEIRGGRILLTDLDSSSGTFVNDQRVSECQLQDGDVIRIGNTQLRLEKSDAGEKAAVPEAGAPLLPALPSAEKLHELTGRNLSHYQLGDVLARGQSGLVFRAYDFKHDRPAALKVLWPEFSKNEDDVQRFIRAMKTMLPLRHPNLIALYGAGKTGPYCWIAMERVEGESLAQVLQNRAVNRLNWKGVLRIGYYLAKALEYAHGHDIIHRNLTPQNVMIGQKPEHTKLGDLMLAKALEGGLAREITKPGEILGDLRYMSPERTGGGDIDHRSDLYSLGALMYALLTGRPPLEGKNMVETIIRIRQDEPVKPKQFQPVLPDRVEGVILKLLAKRPDDRYPSAAALLDELEKLAKHHNITL
jgi:serine/threonine protein kinase